MTDVNGHDVNNVINELGSLARRLDEQVYETAMDTGLTERAEITADYDARQRMVRRMAGLMYELNSMLPDRMGYPVTDDTQPIEYR
jgi:chemotaxis regulatin CheY-phosphate phosphatase CheZ